MKLSKLFEEIEDPKDVVYHLTPDNNLPTILKNGLHSENKRYKDAAEGVYVFTGIDNYSDMIYYLFCGEEQPLALIEIGIGIMSDGMMADEDSLSPLGERIIRPDFSERYPDEATELKSILDSTPDNRLQDVKIDFVERHNIGPLPLNVVNSYPIVGRYIGRITPNLIKNVWKINDNGDLIPLKNELK